MATDWTHREALGEAAALRVVAHREAGKTTSLTDYVSRMPEEQKEIYYLLAPNREARGGEPVFRGLPREEIRGAFPVRDPRDEFVMEHLREFDKKRVIAAEKADLKLDEGSATR